MNVSLEYVNEYSLPT